MNVQLMVFCKHIQTSVLWGVCVFLSHCTQDLPVTRSAQSATSRPYVIKGKLYVPQQHYELEEEGFASHYGGPDGCHGSLTATGERFNMYEMTGAHPTLPLPCKILVQNLENGRSAVLIINDRGPFAKNRILDVSVQAAHCLGFYHKGTAWVRIKTLVPESLTLVRQYKKCPQIYMAQKAARLHGGKGPLSDPSSGTQAYKLQSSCAPSRTHISEVFNQYFCSVNASSSQQISRVLRPVMRHRIPVQASYSKPLHKLYVVISSPSLGKALSVEEKVRRYGQTDMRKKGHELFQVFIGPFHMLAQAQNVKNQISHFYPATVVRE